MLETTKAACDGVVHDKAEEAGLEGSATVWLEFGDAGCWWKPGG